METLSPQSSVRTFYDAFDRQLLCQYGHGNGRIEAAIRHVLRWLDRDARSILDVGCGIGWSSWELHRHRPDARILGLDLSPRLIELATTLFAGPGVTFQAGDLLENPTLKASGVDAIVMLDAYEHIPRSRRPALHRAFDAWLADTSSLLMTFPSVQYQQYLRQHEPAKLQPVDEDVTRSDMEQLADELGGHLLCFEPVSIWRDGDYVHAAIRRGVGTRRPASAQTKLAPKEERLRHIERKLQVRPTPKGLLLPRRSGPSVCIVSPQQHATTETFITSHVERWPGRVCVLNGGPGSMADQDGHAVLAQSLPARAYRYARRKLARADTSEIQATVRHLRRHGVQAILAEYGPTGAMMAPIARRSGLPLIVHFHGQDAYAHRTLDQHRASYAVMFDDAAGIIAVSRAMEKQLLSLGAPREKLYYNPYGVDCAKFKGAEPSKAPPHFVSVGRFVDKKAPHLLLLAFQQLLASRPDTRLVMVGDGPLLASAQEMAGVLGLSDAVRFLGATDQRTVRETMRRARAFVQHSIRPASGDSEGTPVAVLEASASGLPVIATRHAGIIDAVVDNETGLLVEERDIAGMARAMGRVADDPIWAGQLGAAGRRRTEELFHIDRSMQNLVGIVEAAIAASRRRRSHPGTAEAGLPAVGNPMTMAKGVRKVGA